ncbi:MAG TPA: aldo/keto reductase [Patescibacteria group bacterium]|nr:aldo/keto reductase [Patescibacteria group bacterium]
MTIPTKKLKSGFEIPVYGLGTWQMGGRETRNPENDDEADIQAIKSAIDLGVTHIDTAESYAQGYAEILVGKAIKGYDRSKLLIVSKAHADHLAYDDLIHAAKESLKRLETTYLDLYLAHRYNPEIPVKETMRAMDTLMDEGLIRNIGVSNFNVEELQEAQSYTKNKIVANQLHLNLKYREAQRKGLLEYCQQNDVMFIAWRPLQKSVLLTEKGHILDEMAHKYDATPAQIAINWLISLPNVVMLSKTRSIKHLKENLGALEFKMSQEDIDKLTNEYPDQQDVSDTVPLH